MNSFEILCPLGHPTEWRGLYRQEYDLTTPESMTHPAKAAWGLAFRIVEHLEELELLRPGMTVLDPMAGTGRLCLAACARGYRSVALELESRFVEMMRSNKAYATSKLHRGMEWEILQGDARNLAGLLDDVGQYPHSVGQIGDLSDPAVAITSPPYGDAMGDWKNKDAAQPGQFYGEGSKQIGNIPESLEGGTKADWWRKKALEGCKETYQEAMLQVYQQLALCCPILVVVVKDPTRNGHLRELGRDTVSLMEAAGYRIFDYHQSLLFEEQEQGHLFDGAIKKVRGRMSFFKRLAYARGSVVADREHVIFGRTST